MTHKYSIDSCKTVKDQVQWFFFALTSFNLWARKLNKTQNDIDNLTEVEATTLMNRYRSRTDYAIDKKCQWYFFDNTDTWVKIPKPEDTLGLEPNVWEELHFNR